MTLPAIFWPWEKTHGKNYIGGDELLRRNTLGGKD